MKLNKQLEWLLELYKIQDNLHWYGVDHPSVESRLVAIEKHYKENPKEIKIDYMSYHY